MPALASILLSATGASVAFGALSWTEPWPPIFTIAAIVIGVAAIWLGYRRQSIASTLQRWTLFGLRTAAFAIVVFMLHRLSFQPTTSSPPDLVVCVDTSASMQTIDAYQGDQAERIHKRLKGAKLSTASRLNQAKSIFHAHEKSRSRWKSQFHLKLKTLADEIITGDALSELFQLEATLDDSPIGEMLRSALNEQRGQPTSALVLVSDGINTSGTTLEAIAELALRRKIPVFAIALGSDHPNRDIELATANADPVAFVNDVVTVSCNVNVSGFSGSDVDIRLRRAGSDETLSSQRLRLSEGSQAVRFTDQPNVAGRIEYIIDIDTLDGESNTTNNQTSVFVDVRDETINVLLVQAYPHFEYRFLKSLFERDAQQGNSTIHLTTILQEADPELSQIDRSAANIFPVTMDELLEYDILLIGDIDPAGLGSTAVSNIAKAIIEHGRSAIFVLGPENSSTLFQNQVISQLAPFDVDGGMALSEPSSTEGYTDELRMRLTAVGRSSGNCQLSVDRAHSDSMWDQLPPVYWRSIPKTMKRGVRTLAEFVDSNRFGARTPAITLHYAGAGQVLCHFFDDSWRWQYRSADERFGRYWLQTVRMLGRNKLRTEVLGEIACLSDSIHDGDEISFRATLFRESESADFGEAPTLIIESGGRTVSEQPLTLDLTSSSEYRATIAPLPPAMYSAWVRSIGIPARSIRCEFSVAPRTTEMSRLSTDFASLELLATKTGGKAYTESNADRLFRELPEPKSKRTQQMPSQAIWNSPWLATVFLAVLASEWIIRRRNGLV